MNTVSPIKEQFDSLNIMLRKRSEAMMIPGLDYRLRNLAEAVNTNETQREAAAKLLQPDTVPNLFKAVAAENHPIDPNAEDITFNLAIDSANFIGFRTAVSNLLFDLRQTLGLEPAAVQSPDVLDLAGAFLGERPGTLAQVKKHIEGS